MDRVLGVDGWLGPTEVHFRDGVISGIHPSSGPDDGSLLVPGFIDLQVNGKGEISVFTTSDAGWQALQDLVIAEGVTTWLPTLITDDLAVLDVRMRTLVRRCADGGIPDVAGIHLEGPFLGSVPGAHPAKHIARPDSSWLDHLPPEVRLMTVGGEEADSVGLVQQLRDRGVVVSLGHTNLSSEAFTAAIEAGAVMVTHLFNAMGGIHHRRAGLAALALTASGVAVSIIADGVHVDSAWLGVAAAAKSAEELILVTDSVAIIDGVSISGDTTPVARLSDGTIAGSVLTMDAAVRHMVNDVGIPLEHAIAAASTNPARILGLSDRGVIAVGKRADLVVLTQDLAIGRVFVAGQEASL